MGARGPGARGKGQGPRTFPVTPTTRIVPVPPRLSRAQRIISFCESLPITKGLLEGQQMRLLPAQKRFIRAVYGHGGKFPPSIRLAVLSAPRGSGKTGLLAALTLAHLLGPEAIPRGACYSAAVDRDQSALLFNEMVATIYAVPELDARCNVIKHFKRIEVLSGPGAGSTYEAMSGDAKRGHGLAPSFWCFDELGRVRDRELLDALVTGGGKQPGSLGVIISTQAASDDHPLSQIIDDGLLGTDSSVYVQLHAAPIEADPLSMKTVRACNFALGKFLDPAALKDEMRRASRIPAFMSAFRNLRLNQRVNADDALIGRDDWLACGGTLPDDGALRGRRCWGGLDLSSTTDLSALVLVFEGDPMPVLAFHWAPKGNLEAMEFRNKIQYYRQWVEEGLLELTTGRAIDKSAIAIRLAEIASKYQVQAIAYDDWRFSDLAKMLDDMGIVLPLKPLRQGFKSMAPCVDALERAVVDRKIVHGNNPLLTYNIASAVADINPAGERKLNKKRSRTHIDSAVCLAMALGMQATEPGPITYNFDLPMVLTA